MKLYVNAAYWFLATVLLGLVVSYAYGQPTSHVNDEIGEYATALIKQELKEPFLVLLASSPHAKKQNVQNRIDAVEKAFAKFKMSYANMSGSGSSSAAESSQNMSTMSSQPIMSSEQSSQSMGAMSSQPISSEMQSSPMQDSNIQNIMTSMPQSAMPSAGMQSTSQSAQVMLPPMTMPVAEPASMPSGITLSTDQAAPVASAAAPSEAVMGQPVDSAIPMPPEDSSIPNAPA